MDVILAMVNRSLEKHKLKIANGKYLAAVPALVSSAHRSRKSINTKKDHCINIMAKSK